MTDHVPFGIEDTWSNTTKEKVQQVRSTLESLCSDNMQIKHTSSSGFSFYRTYENEQLDDELVAFTHFTSDYGLHVIIEGSHSFDMDVELVAMACRSAKCPHLTRY